LERGAAGRQRIRATSRGDALVRATPEASRFTETETNSTLARHQAAASDWRFVAVFLLGYDLLFFVITELSS
jgi:hypothetical protein